MATAADARGLLSSVDLMARHMERASGSVVLLATASDDELERAVAEALAERLSGIALRDFRFEPGKPGLPAFLRSLPLPDGPSAVLAHGLDDLPGEERRRAIDDLNMGRETIRWTGHSVVLWLRPESLSDLPFRAPDFFAVRSQLIQLIWPDRPASRDEALGALRMGTVSEHETLRRRYRSYVLASYRWLDFRGLLQVRTIVRLKLEDLFVPLRAEKEASVAERPTLPLRMLEERADRTAATEAGHEQTVERLPKARERISLAAALRASTRLVVLGDPGSGKTTLLKHLALTFADGRSVVRERLELDEERLPILVPLAAYALTLRDEPELDLRGFVPRYFMDLGLPDLEPLFQEALPGGTALVLLDGLDEIVDPRTRGTVLLAIERLVRAHPDSRYVVTSRTAGYASMRLTAAFEVVTINPFERADIEKFCVQWSRAYEGLEHGPGSELPPEAEIRAQQRARGLTDAIVASPPIERISETPLLLTLLALIHHQGTRLPHRRAELYRLCVQALAETWNRARSLAGKPIDLWLGDKPLDERAVVNILAPLAFWMHERQPGALIDRGNLEDTVARVLTEGAEEPSDRASRLAREFVDIVRDQTGLLAEQAPDRFGFMHLTFEEYLAARHIASRRDPFHPVKPHLHDPRWREVILLSAASLEGENATAFVKAIRGASSPYHRLLHLDLFLASRCLADDVHVDLQIRRKLVGELIQVALEDTYEGAREEATSLLASLPGTTAGTDALRQLIAAWAHAGRRLNSTARARILSALAHFASNSKEAADTLASALEDRDGVVRSAAIRSAAAARFAPERLRRKLVGLLEDEDAAVRSAAVRALVDLVHRSPSALAALSRLLDDKHPYVRAMAARGIIELDGASELVLTTLRRSIEVGYGFLSKVIAEGLRRRSWPADELLPHLLPLSGKSKLERWAAIEVLGVIRARSDEVVAALIGILREGDVVDRWTAAKTLGQIGDSSDRVRDALIQACENKDADVRLEAARALGVLGLSPQVAIATLSKLVEARSPTLRKGAAEVLLSLGYPQERLVPAVLDMLESSPSTEGMGELLGRIAPASRAVLGTLVRVVSRVSLQSRFDDAADEAWRALFRIVPKLYGERSRIALVTRRRGPSWKRSRSA